MAIKGMARERKYRKRRYGMKVDGYGLRRVHLALVQRALAGQAPANSQRLPR